MLRAQVLLGGLLASLLIAVWAIPAPAQTDTQASAAPADANVPQSAMTELEQKFELPRKPTSREEALAMQATQMLEVIKFGESLEAKYPKAPNLYEVRQRMLYAADFYARYKPETAGNRTKIAERILASDAPPDAKVTPDYFIAVEKIAPADGEVAKDAAQQIQAFAGRYAKTDAAGVALVRASQLADKARLSALETELLDKLEKDYSQDPQIQRFLKQKGRGATFVGKKFQADLTLTDGKKLNLPDDLLGKVVVIDFWATWCGPCIREIPHMKKVYAAYKDKGVEFVGVSLDRPDKKQDLIDFVTKNEMPWLQTYSGKYWQDPTARKYGIEGIPSIWVIGKDGNIFSDNARADLEGTLDKALAQKAAGQ